MIPSLVPSFERLALSKTCLSCLAHTVGPGLNTRATALLCPVHCPILDNLNREIIKEVNMIFAILGIKKGYTPFSKA